MDAFAECANVVRDLNRDRYLADLFAPEASRKHLFALHAFNAEVAAIRDRVTDPRLGEIRLTWWKDALPDGGRGHPIAAALAETITAFHLPFDAFERLLRARVFDLYDDPMPSLNDLEGYAGDTASAVFQLGAIILAGGRNPGTAELSGHAGVAQTIAGILRGLAGDPVRNRSFIPADLAARHRLDLTSVTRDASSVELKAVVEDLVRDARRHLAAARTYLASSDPVVRPTYLPLALVEPYLARVDRAGFDPRRAGADIPQWRKQWQLWRASRSAALI
jgi:phytoene synthase